MEQELGEEEDWLSEAHGIQGGSKIILYDTVILVIRYYAFVKTHRIYSTKSTM